MGIGIGIAIAGMWIGAGMAESGAGMAESGGAFMCALIGTLMLAAAACDN